MSVVAYRALAEVRSRWVGTVILALLVALAGSLGIAGVAGARRAATAADRLVAEVGQPDLVAYDVGEADLDAVMAIDGAATYSATFILADAVDPAGPIVAFARSDLSVGGQLVEGSFPHAENATGAVIDLRAANVLDLRVGDPVLLGTYSAAQLAEFDFSGPKGPQIELTVEAIVREPDDVTPGDPSADEQVGYANDGGIYVPLSFLDRYGDEVGTVNTSIAFVLDRGVKTEDAVAAIRDLPRGETVQFFSAPGFDPATRRAVQIEAISLLLVTALLVLAAGLALGQALARRVTQADAEGDTLNALGVGPGQRIAIAGFAGFVVGVPGAVLAVVGAVILSRWTPLGLARDLEPDPGIEVNTLVLASGFAVVALVVIGSALLAGRASLRRRRSPDGVSSSATLSRIAARVGAPVTVVSGFAHAAVQRRSGPSIRSAVATAGAFVAVLVAALTMTASLDHIQGNPVRYGWTFDAVAGSPFTGDAEQIINGLEGLPGVDSLARAGSTTVQLKGEEFDLIGIEPLTGQRLALVEEGREPRSAGEVVLGRRTLEAIGARIGDTIAVDAGSGSTDLEITGTAIVPEIGAAGYGFGEGAVTTLETLTGLSPDFAAPIVLVRYEPGVSADERQMIRNAAGGLLLEPVLPTAIYDLVRVRGMPLLIAGLLAAMAAATVVHTLASLARARRRDLAVLRTIGFTRHQVAGGVLALGVASVLAAAAVGLPLGAALGRTLWSALIEDLGAEPRATVPVLAVLLLVPAVAIGAAALAGVPSWRAARLHPAEELRSTD